MTDSIGPSYNLPPPRSETATTNVPLLAKKMQNQVQNLAENLQKIVDDPSLTEQSTFLQKMSEDVSHLNLTVGQAIKLR
jgi:hypothetical protein